MASHTMTWTELEGGAWQRSSTRSTRCEPTLTSSPLMSKSAFPIDISDVRSIGFAPQDRTAGHFAFSKFVVVE